MNPEIQKEDYVSKELKKYSLADTKIIELRNKYLKIKVNGIDDIDGYALCKSAHQEIKAIRLGIEEKRQELKASSLDFGRKVDAEAKRLSIQIIEIETHLLSQRKVIEDEKKRIKEEEQEAIRKEEERIKKEEELRIEKIRLEQEKKERELEEKQEKIREEQKKIEEEKQEIERQKQKIIEIEEAKKRAAEQARIEKEKIEKETEQAVEKARLEKEKLEKILKNQVECPKCHHKFQINKEKN